MQTMKKVYIKMLKEKAISGLKWTALSNVILSVLQIVQISVLTHYLATDDFGLMAIVMVVIGFSKIFSDMGISNAIIHHQHTSHEQLSSLYWLNIMSGLFLFFIISGVAPFIASFYNQPKLINLLILLASTFIVLSIGNQYRILFQKELLFNFMAKIEISAAIIAFIVALASAISDLGVYALAYATLANAIVSSSLYFFFGIQRHKPSFLYNHQAIKKYIGFGLFQMGENTLNFFNSQFDVILIGKLLGLEVLGIYSVMKQLSMKPAGIINPIINRVAFPVLSKVQNNDNKLKNIYLNIINTIASINFPIYIAIVILAEPIVAIMFGDKFQSGVPILQVLSIYAMLRSTSNPIGSLLMAKGRVDIGFYWTIILFTFIPLSIYIGSQFGIMGVVYALISLQIILMIPSWFFMIKKMCGATFIEFFKQILIPLILSVIAGSIAFIGMIIASNYLLQLILVSFIGLLVYLLLLYKFNKNFINSVKDLKK